MSAVHPDERRQVLRRWVTVKPAIADRVVPTSIRLTKIVVFGWVILAFFMQVDVGLADNSDFSRLTLKFSSGPVDIESNWPDRQINEEEWQRRFFQYWIPYWKLDFPNTYTSLKSSVLLLWYPGIALNYLFYSNNVLFLHVLSIVPKLLTLLGLFLLTKRLDQNRAAERAPWLYPLLLLPLAIITTTIDYTAFYSSFYFEAASITFFLAFFFFLLLHREKKRPYLTLVVGLVLLGLLTTAKASNIYWPILGGGFLLWMVPFHAKRWKKTVLAVFACATLLWLGSSISNNKILTSFNQYNSLFYGVLTLSEAPSQQIIDLNMLGGRDCIGKMVWTADGQGCYQLYGDEMSFANTVQVILREPELIWHIQTYITDNMQEISLGYLGQRAENATFTYSPQFGHQSTLNFWSLAKSTFMPRGIGLITLLVGFLVLFGWGSTRANLNDFGRKMAQIGLLLTLVIPIDMNIAFLGDGKQELVKHLILSNFMFDIALILAINVGVFVVIAPYRNKQT